MIDAIADLLARGANSSLRYHKNSNLRRHLAQVIARHFDDETDASVLLPQLAALIMEHDYRLVAEYLAAWKRCDRVMLSIFQGMIATEDLITFNRQRYQHIYTRFLRTAAHSRKADVFYTSQLDDVFSSEKQQLVIYLRDEKYKVQLVNIIDDVGTEFSRFIEQQYDVPGLNAVVRQGQVRKWYFPNGSGVISKRENLRKKDRFRREQTNYGILLDRLGKSPRPLLNSPTPATFQVAQPFAVIYDGYRGHRYALFAYEEGISLEDIFLTEPDSVLRHQFLAHFRLLLDSLYESGILWGDMSPRNILSRQQDGVTTYTLLDFEKTSVLDSPIPLAQRIENCRGQICVEELCVLCPLDEVLMCFDGYFDPSSWDLDSEIALPFPPRPDVADILRGRGVANVTVGEHNRVDSAILAVRVPDVDPQTEARRFPGHLGFKVEHYLSCAGSLEAGEYDRKTTEVLIAAKQHTCFDEVVTLLTDLTNAVEGAFLDREFQALLGGGFSGNVESPQHEVWELTETLDSLYQTRQHGDAYRQTVAQRRSIMKRD